MLIKQFSLEILLKKIIIFGTSDLARNIERYLTRDSMYNVVGFSIHQKFITEESVNGLPVIPFEGIEEQYPADKFSMFIAIGYSELNKKRERVFNEAKAKGYELLSWVHPSTKLWDDFKMGENCFIFENNVIQPSVKLGDDVIIRSGNLIGHNCDIRDHNLITSRTAIAGHVIIEPYCFVGINATIRNSITIAKACVIGAGTCILEDTKEGEVFVSNSTKKLGIKSNELKSL